MTIAIRWILTAAILWQAWMHSHWSVALTLTALSFSNEIQALVSNERHKLLIELAGKFIDGKRQHEERAQKISDSIARGARFSRGPQ